MKKFITIAALGMLLFSCGTSRQSMHAQPIIDTYGSEEKLTDTFLHRLQQQNDVVLAAYTESLAWGIHYNYTIAVQKNGVWKGYIYTISGTRANASASVSEVNIDNKATNGVAGFLNNAALWSGKDNRESCSTHVSDGSSSYLVMASGNKVLTLKYYMPEVYQKNCPDSSRQLFLDAFGKVQRLFNYNNAK